MLPDVASRFPIIADQNVRLVDKVGGELRPWWTVPNIQKQAKLGRDRGRWCSTMPWCSGGRPALAFLGSAKVLARHVWPSSAKVYFAQLMPTTWAELSSLVSVGKNWTSNPRALQRPLHCNVGKSLQSLDFSMFFSSRQCWSGLVSHNSSAWSVELFELR